MKKFIHLSTLSVYGEPDEEFINETTPLATNQNAAYIKTKIQSEEVLNKYRTKGLDVIILRPGAICAEENSYWGDRQVTRMLETEHVNWIHPEDRVPWIHADNLAEMIDLVLTKGKSGDVFNAIDGNFPEEKFRVRLIQALGKTLQVPNRKAERSIYSNEKILALGYRLNKTFDQTVENLVHLALSKRLW